MTQVASLSLAQDDGPWLRSRTWDRIFVTGGAWLVALPIVLHYLFTWAGAPRAMSEDLVTLVVMVLVGGPHVFATYTRTFFEPDFSRREPVMFYGAFAVMAVVLGAVVSSAFFDVRIAGFPPIQFVMTFFFFWAGVHIVHQSSYLCAAYEERRGGARTRARKLGNALDYLVMLGCLYPVAFFRMSMIGDPAHADVANPDALATSIVVSLSGSQAFADEYVFRIGRVAPILPDFVVADAFWISFSALYLVGLVLFLVKTRREHRDGTLNRARFRLVASTAFVGLIVPLFPNLDTAFQGFNAWHSFQYLGIVWLWNRRAYDEGKLRGAIPRAISGPDRASSFYLTALAATVGLLLVILCTGWLIELSSAGRFRMFGLDTIPIDPATGRPEYRPGAVLLAYYMVAFSLLLVHYLHDGHYFFRPRDLRGAERVAG